MTNTEQNMTAIKLMWGKEIFTDKSAKVSVWAVPCQKFTGLENEHHVSYLLQDNTIDYMKPINKPVNRSSRRETGYRAELGSWWDCPSLIADGGMLKIFAQRNMGLGRRKDIMNMIIRVRASAPMYHLKVNLTGDPSASYSFCDVIGRFDILTTAQAKARGVKIDDRFIHTYYHPEENAGARFFTITEQEEAIAEMKPIVEKEIISEEGKKVRVARVRSLREFDLE